MRFEEFTALLEDLLPRDGRPVVAYAGLLAIAREFPPPTAALPERLLRCLLDAVGPERTLLMPTYTQGFGAGVIDLDAAPGNTGMMNELLRRMPSARRTRSAFFSFTALGPQSGELASLEPKDAWGDGSVFDWIWKHDAHILMIGVPWPMCSFLHIVEWLGDVPYRYLKDFSGEVVAKGRRAPLGERLFVRSLDPLVQNAWNGLDEILEKHGMRRVKIGRGQLATIGADALVQALLPVMRSDPFAFVDHPETMRAAFGGKPGGRALSNSAR